jgi:rhodanese-related sulfurtransferase
MILRLFLITLMSLFSFSSFAITLGQLTPQKLEQFQSEKNALVIDIRTTEEWIETGIVPNSHPLQFFDKSGKYDQKKWLEDLQALHTSPNTPIILVCRSGNRSNMVGKLLIQQLKMKNIYHLSKGILHWKTSSHPVADYQRTD